MNYLGHAYFSYYQPQLLLGNLMNDFVKGKQQYSYSIAIQQGFALHRAIDMFTDAHASTRQATKLFTPAAGRYASVMVDIAYDYFIANDKTLFPAENSLEHLAQFTYKTLQENKELLPEKLQQMLPYMIRENWLVNYRQPWGIQKSMQNIARRATQLSSAEPSFEYLTQNTLLLQELYQIFIKDAATFVDTYLHTSGIKFA